jgi:hypothetical protein
MAEILRAAEGGTLRRAVKTDCEVVTEHDFRLLGSRTLDVSPEGMRLECLLGACVGEPVFVSLRVPGTRLWVDAAGTVARVLRGRRRYDQLPAVGVRFHRIDAPDHALLVASLRGVPPPVPGRSIRRNYAATVRLIWDYSQHAVRQLSGRLPRPGVAVPAWAVGLV